MTQWVKALFSKLGNPSSLPETHMVDGKAAPTSCPLTSVSTPLLAHVLFMSNQSVNKINKISIIITVLNFMILYYSRVQLFY